ncbi:hypothetical protein NL676_017933 [Syzygium grande]|nr:hypothetical protein NL676_017933 [Syzygium grande]
MTEAACRREPESYKDYAVASSSYIRNWPLVSCERIGNLDSLPNPIDNMIAEAHFNRKEPDCRRGETRPGVYGTVYKGKLSNEIFVTVKMLDNAFGNGEEFINEVSTMGRIHHVNMVRMVGFCTDGF